MEPRQLDNSPASLKSVIIGGVKTACISRQELAELMVSDCIAARATPRNPRLIFDANGHGLSLAATDSRFREYLDEADLIHADGQVIVTASKLLTSAPIPERSATTDFFHDAAQTASAAGLRIFLFGGTKEVNDECVAVMRRKHPSL